MSKRGSEGGYFLARSADSLSAGEIIRFIEGSVAPVECVRDEGVGTCPLRGKCVFMPMWKDAQQAMENVYDSTSFQDLIDQEALAPEHGQEPVLMYCI